MDAFLVVGVPVMCLRYPLRLSLLASATLLVLGLPGQAIADPRWRAEPITLQSPGRPLAEVLREAVNAGGLHADVPRRLSGTVEGTFNQSPQQIFLRLVDAYDLAWWADGDVIRVSNASDQQSRTLDIWPMRADEAIALLRRLRISSAHLPVQASGSLLRLSGPARYVQTAAEALGNARAQSARRSPGADGGPAPEIRVFPLRQAQAADVVQEDGEGQRSVAGIATLLRQLVQAQVPAPDWTDAPGDADTPVDAGPSAAERHASVAASGDVQVIADPRSNAVIVRAPAPLMAHLAQAIAVLDTRQEVIELEASILDVSSGQERALGIEWLSLGQASAGTEAAPILDEDARGLLLRVQALEAEGKASFRSHPRIVTLNNAEAQIHSLREMHVRVAGQQAVNLYPVQAGLDLRVTPTLSPDPEGDIRLAIDIQDGAMEGATPVDDIPIVSRHRIRTQAVVRPGESLLIGGYRFERELDSTRRVPWLSRIPLIGALFRSRQRQTQTFERLILITPRRRGAVDEDTSAPRMPA